MDQTLPLREALRLAPLRRARVVAGAAGLDRPVAHVNVMEVPDITGYVKPNQLLLTTAYPLRDERAELAALVPRLARRGLAGLAIKPARYIDAIPETMIESAERLGFPLLELPPETSFEEIITAVLGQLLNAQALRLQRSAAIHDRFTRIVLSGGGLREIVQVLSELIGCPALVADPDGTVLAHSGEALARELGGALASLLEPAEDRADSAGASLRWARLPLSSGPRSVAIQPVLVDAWRQGAIVVAAEAGSLGEEQLAALEQAATVTALRLVQARAVAESDRRFRVVCLEELVTGQVADRELLRERALAFGWDLSLPRAVLVAELEALGGRRFTQLVGSPEEGRAWHRLAEAAASALGKEAIVWERSAGLAALVAPAGGAAARLGEVARRLQVEAGRRLPGAVVGVGIGRLCRDPLELHRGHLEALRALSVGRRARGPGQITLFDDLGLDRLLASCPDDELASFWQVTLGRLAAYDAAHDAGLLDSLEAYLAHQGNVARAARALFVHYNTLRNRLARIEQLVGPFQTDPERCLSLALALHATRFLER
jgi:purine catabolism regulator